MGEVYLAEDTTLSRRVALKLLPHEQTQNEERVRRFKQEAKAASALNHPNILTIHEVGEAEGRHFIATEFSDGETLRASFRRAGRMKTNEALNVAAQVASALAAAHEAGIVHRDIKPENIMIRRDGYVKVLDFGLAKLTETVAPQSVDTSAPTKPLAAHTDTGVVLGTAQYMSPEQARGLTVDALTDIWSSGCVLYEMLTGRAPFAGETVTDMLVAIVGREPPPLKSLTIEEIPDELDWIITKTLRKDREERYQTSKELLVDLLRLKERLEFEARLERASPPNKSAEAKTQIIRAETTAPAETRNSIAVLPFANMSADAENEYLCDGLAEELLNALAKIEDLKVAARTSAFSFKNKNVEVSEIGKALRVETILEGSVRKSGNRLRITVQLVNAADGYHLWSERYDREVKDIFDIQDEITLAVVNALKVKLLGEEKAAILKRYTYNTEAYELYLKGLHHSYRWTDESYRKSLEYFEKALEKDPEFAPAHAKIADYYSFHSHVGGLSPNEIILKWRAAAQRALAIDEGLADAHLAMAHIYFYYDRDWAKAGREFQRAVELNPNSAQAHKHYGLFLSSRERFDQALAEGKKALELDPLSVAVNFVVSWTYLYVDRFDDALGLVRLMRELDANAPQSYWLEGNLLVANGKYEGAVEAFQKSLTLGVNQMALSMLGCAYGLAGRSDEALEILAQLFEMREQQYAAAFNIARVYAGLGDKDNAFEWLEKAVEERNAELVHLKRLVEAGAGVYFGKNFSADPRYHRILRRAGLLTNERYSHEFAQ